MRPLLAAGSFGDQNRAENTIKKLLLILCLATLLFMSLAIFQEWETFRYVFSPAAEPERLFCNQEAVKVVENFSAVLRHVYGSGGDIRFLERLPAASSIKDEVITDLKYLARNGRYQQMNLQKIEFQSNLLLGKNTCEVKTKEYWIIRYLNSRGQYFDEKPIAVVGNWRYLIRKGITGWEIYWMEPFDES